MYKKLRPVLTALLLAVFLVSAVMLVRHLLDYRAAKDAYSEAEAIAALPPMEEAAPSAPSAPAEEAGPEQEQEASAPADPDAALLQSMDLEALRAVNSDVLGWISIPDTVLSYPLVRGSDNQYYLTHTWNGSRNSVGAIFMDCRSPADLSGGNTILYGHRMIDGSMFASLKYYSTQSYLSAHPSVYLADDTGVHRYAIFAAYEASVTSAVYQTSFASAAEKQAMIDEALSRSAVSTGVSPTADDRILTLSTCTGSGHATRWVVLAVWAETVPYDAAA